MIVSDRAFAIGLRGRYYVRHGKGDRVLTAWSLAGATLFLPGQLLNRTVARLRQKGHLPRVITIVEDQES